MSKEKARQCPIPINHTNSKTTEANTRTVRRTAEDKRKAEEEAAEQERRDAYIGSLLGMQTTPMELKANTLFSILTHAAMECMTAATTMLSGTAEAAPPPNARWDRPNARNARRYAELQNLARLSEAGSRILDAYTRLRASNHRKVVIHNVSRQRREDGSYEQTTYRQFTPMPGPDQNFDPGTKGHDETLQRAMADGPSPFPAGS